MDKKNINKGDIAKVTAGASSAAVGGALLLKTLKTKKLAPKEEKELIEIVKKSGKKPGEYLYRRAVRNQSLRKAANKATRNSVGSRAAGWLGSGSRAFSNIENDDIMEIRRKVFSLLQDETGEERYYSTNEFEISWDEETNEKTFSVKEKIEDTARKVGDAAGKGFIWMKTKTGEWVKVAKESIHEAAGKVAEGTKKVATKVAEGTKEVAGKVAEGAKTAANKVAEGAKAGAGKVAAGAKAAGKWAAAHPVAATGIGVGAAAVGTGAVLGAKAIKKNKENK